MWYPTFTGNWFLAWQQVLPPLTLVIKNKEMMQESLLSMGPTEMLDVVAERKTWTPLWETKLFINLSIVVFWVVMPYVLTNGYQHFILKMRWYIPLKHCNYLQDHTVSQPMIFTAMRILNVWNHVTLLSASKVDGWTLATHP